MPTINYFYADVYPDQLGMPDVSVVISDEEWNRRIEQEHHWESNGRMARREVSLFDAIHAEVLGEHNAEKAKVRNRRKADRKEKERNPRYIKRNGGKFDRNVWYEGSKVFHWEEDLRMPERRANSKAESEERDYAVELRNRDDALAEHSDYLDMAIDHAEKLEYWRNKKASVEYWELMIDEVSRQIIYEQNRVNELMRIADTLMEGECY